jgi:hypothetical protein
MTASVQVLQLLEEVLGSKATSLSGYNFLAEYPTDMPAAILQGGSREWAGYHRPQHDLSHVQHYSCQTDRSFQPAIDCIRDRCKLPFRAEDKDMMEVAGLARTISSVPTRGTVLHEGLEHVLELHVQQPQPSRPFEQADFVLKTLPACVTTLCIRNLPPRCTRWDLASIWRPEGSWNLLYLPWIPKRRVVRYVFINFVSPEAAVSFYNAWQGQNACFLGSIGSDQQLDISAADIQGYEANLWNMRSGKSSCIRNQNYMPILIGPDGTQLDFRDTMAAMAAIEGKDARDLNQRKKSEIGTRMTLSDALKNFGLPN